ncbi:MAG: F0F1 ATP synthase subunit epsilon [Flavobacteriia bacterium]|jgi:F-type H+-transporting ATPase subunit epsilon|nr:F0F1 ATP synthase subunit epsilon [Flavobacteriia bacterium]
MKLDIISPEESLFSGEIDSISLPGLDGRLQLLNGHAPVIAALKEGQLWFESKHIGEHHPLVQKNVAKSEMFHLEIKGGVVEMLNNDVVVLLD